MNVDKTDVYLQKKHMFQKYVQNIYMYIYKNCEICVKKNMK